MAPKIRCPQRHRSARRSRRQPRLLGRCRRRAQQRPPVPAGFADFDKLTNGLHPGQMIIVAA
ncbi:hypothetical protein, partial [Gordonia paraffinivorans]|uniref:hypothetical protein n=1 Tax=Gordonia paraffinivorans TaxID=175628 RepID=UPI001B357667